MLFEAHIPAWKTRSGSRMDERALSYQHGEAGGKRNSDTTLKHDENVEKLHDENIDRNAGSENVDKIQEENSDRASGFV